MQMLDHLIGGSAQRSTLMLRVLECETSVALDVHPHNLNVRFTITQIVLARQQFSHLAKALVIVNRRDLHLIVAIVVHHAKQFQVAHHFGRQKLLNEALILKVPHGAMKYVQPIRARYVREP